MFNLSTGQASIQRLPLPVRTGNSLRLLRMARDCAIEARDARALDAAARNTYAGLRKQAELGSQQGLQLYADLWARTLEKSAAHGVASGMASTLIPVVSILQNFSMEPLEGNYRAVNYRTINRILRASARTPLDRVEAGSATRLTPALLTGIADRLPQYNRREADNGWGEIEQEFIRIMSGVPAWKAVLRNRSDDLRRAELNRTALHGKARAPARPAPVPKGTPGAISVNTPLDVHHRLTRILGSGYQGRIIEAARFVRMVGHFPQLVRGIDGRQNRVIVKGLVAGMRREEKPALQAAKAFADYATAAGLPRLQEAWIKWPHVRMALSLLNGDKARCTSLAKLARQDRKLAKASSKPTGVSAAGLARTRQSVAFSGRRGRGTALENRLP